MNIINRSIGWTDWVKHPLKFAGAFWWGKVCLMGKASYNKFAQTSDFWLVESRGLWTVEAFWPASSFYRIMQLSHTLLAELYSRVDNGYWTSNMGMGNLDYEWSCFLVLPSFYYVRLDRNISKLWHRLYTPPYLHIKICMAEVLYW